MTKKKIAFINTVSNGSTGKIMFHLAEKAESCGFQTFCFYGRGFPNANVRCIRIENQLSIYLHVLLARFGFNGHGSYFATKKLIRQLKQINPEIIHLHNVHGYYLNLKLLFRYLSKEYTGFIIWTLHDCWAFTGHCPYFSHIHCNKWKTQCFKCPNLNVYPKENLDTTKYEYQLKKNLFTRLNNLIIVTPSNWLQKIVSHSFLKQYPIKTIHNGVDINVFRRTEDADIFQKYNIPPNKKVLLGVASVWDERKGLDIFLDLAKIIKEDEVILLVGLDKKQIHHLPSNILGIGRVNDTEELAKLYSLATVFMNPSYEETFSLVNVEALACGCPVVTFEIEVMKELLHYNKDVILVNQNTAQSYYEAYLKIVDVNIDRNQIAESAKRYCKESMTKEYMKIYRELTK